MELFQIHERDTTKASCASTDTRTIGPRADTDDGASTCDNAEIEEALKALASSGEGSALITTHGETEVPCAMPDDVCDVEFIIDTGADLDILNQKKGMDLLEDHVRKLSESVSFDTAGGGRSAGKGCRIRAAWWDSPQDFLLLRDSPSLITVGERCQHGPFSFH